MELEGRIDLDKLHIGKPAAAMELSQQQRVDECLTDFRAGTLTEETLRETLESLGRRGESHQALLYLQAGTTSVASGILGMFVVANGETWEGPEDPDDWPYQTVLDALQDGWNIIKFPEVALLMDETKMYGPGVEFVLEKRG